MRVFNLIGLILILGSSLWGANKVIVADNPIVQIELIKFLDHANEEDLHDKIDDFLLNSGYLDYNLTTHGTDSIVIKTGSQYNIGRLVFVGENVDTLNIDQPFNSEIVDLRLDSMITHRQRDGYYYVSATPDRFEKYEGNIDIYYQIVDGPVVLIHNIVYEGVQHTSHEFLNKSSPVGAGRKLTPVNLNRLVADLNQLEIFQSVSEPRIIPTPGFISATVKIKLIEKKQFDFEGFAGFLNDREQSLAWYLKFQGQNIFGGAQNFGFLADNKDKNRSVININYSQPAFWMGQGRWGVEISTRDYRDQFYEFAVDGRYQFRLQSSLYLKMQLGWKNVEPSLSDQQSYQNYLVGLGVKYGHFRSFRDHDAFSLDWDLYFLSRQYKKNDTSSTLLKSVFNDTRLLLQIQGLKSIYRSISIYNNLVLNDIESSEKPLPLSELFLLGGSNGLRGYRNEQFPARRFILLDSEFRLFWSRSDYLYPFFDIAYYENIITDSLGELVNMDDIEWGYGFGLALNQNNRHFNINLAWGRKSLFDEVRVSVQIGASL